MTITMGTALVAAFIAAIWVATYQPAKRRPRNDLGGAFQRGRSRDLAVMRKCCNQSAALIKTPRSISSVGR